MYDMFLSCAICFLSYANIRWCHRRRRRRCRRRCLRANCKYGIAFYLAIVFWLSET